MESLNGRAQQLRPGELLRFQRAEGEIRTAELKRDAIALQFRASVVGMTTGSLDDPSSLMPTWLEWLAERKMLYSLGHGSVPFWSGRRHHAMAEHGGVIEKFATALLVLPFDPLIAYGMLVPPTALAQAWREAEEQTKRLVVMITAGVNVGAGIVYGLDKDGIYIATAHHLVGNLRDTDKIAGRFYKQTDRTFPAEMLTPYDDELDLAVVRVRREAALEPQLLDLSFDRLADLSLLRRGARSTCLAIRRARHGGSISNQSCWPRFGVTSLSSNRGSLMADIRGVPYSQTTAISPACSRGVIRHTEKRSLSTVLAPNSQPGAIRYTCMLLCPGSQPAGALPATSSPPERRVAGKPWEGSRRLSPRNRSIPHYRYRAGAHVRYRHGGKSPLHGCYCYGQIGMGTTSERQESFVPVLGDLTFQAISAGGWHTVD